MPHVGRYIQGTSAPLRVLCRNANGTAAVPDRAPTLAIWSGATRVFSQTVPVIDRYGTTGLFGLNLFLDARFPAGLYRAAFYYSIGGTFHAVYEEGFEVLAGGDSGGTVTSMFLYHRPHADFVIQQLSGGALVQKRNPRLP